MSVIECCMLDGGQTLCTFNGMHQGGSKAPFLDVASNPSTRSDITVGGLLSARQWHSPPLAASAANGGIEQVAI